MTKVRISVIVLITKTILSVYSQSDKLVFSNANNKGGTRQNQYFPIGQLGQLGQLGPSRSIFLLHFEISIFFS